MDLSSTKSKLVIWFLALDLVALNAAIGWVIYGKLVTQPELQITSFAQAIPADNCGANCQAYIDSRISHPTPTPTPTPKTIVPAAPKAKVRTISYLPISTGGSTANRDWTNIAGTEFYFDTSNYPGLVTVYFEANIHLLNGNGIGYVRLFDTAHGIGVQGSDAQTSNQAATLVESGQVSFWAGKNLIRVQAKSLTTETTIFDSGRLRIITEN